LSDIPDIPDIPDMLDSPDLAPVGGLRPELAGIFMLDPLIPGIPAISPAGAVRRAGEVPDAPDFAAPGVPAIPGIPGIAGIPAIPDIPAMLPVAGGFLFGALESAGICIVEGSIPAMLLLDAVSAGATRARDKVADVRPAGGWAADSPFSTAVPAPSEQAEATMLPQIQYSAL
jgi:hypothetical protein